MTDTHADRKPGKAEAIYESVKSAIERGVYAPGQPLGEVMLVQQTGASRTPVREALRRLAAEGLVDFTPRMGASVARISLQSARELFEFRMVLEPAAMRLVADRARRDALVRDNFGDFGQRLKALMKGPDTAARTARFYEMAEEFDRLVLANTPNAYLVRAISEMRPHTVRLRSIAHTAPERMQVSATEHQAMIGALMAGDPDAAAATAKHHLEQTVATIFDALLSESGHARSDQVELRV